MFHNFIGHQEVTETFEDDLEDRILFKRHKDSKYPNNSNDSDDSNDQNLVKDTQQPVPNKPFFNFLNKLDDDELDHPFFSEPSSATKLERFLTDYERRRFECQEHLDEILTFAPLHDDLLFLDKFSMEREEFEKIMIASQHIKTIQLNDCFMDFPNVCDFKGQLKHATFNTLDFGSTGNSLHSKWEDDEGTTFANIIKGLGKEKGVVKNLKTINLYGCDISEEFAEKTLKENGFNNVDLKY